MQERIGLLHKRHVLGGLRGKDQERLRTVARETKLAGRPTGPGGVMSLPNMKHEIARGGAKCEGAVRK